MKKIIAGILVAITLSGCFPVFIPVNDHHGGGHHSGHQRGWGGR